MRAVKHFVRWSKNNDVKKQTYYYPNLQKSELFEKGYIAEKSDHSKGYTVDLTIIRIGNPIKSVTPLNKKLTNGKNITFLDDGTVDMGTSFDYLNVASHHDTDLVSDEVKNNRIILRSAMKKFGFRHIHCEWWHYVMEGTTSEEAYDFQIR